MKNALRRFGIIGIALVLAVTIAGFAQTTAIQYSQQSALAGAALVMQTTQTPEPEDKSEIGSTDEIVAMGGLIALIVVVPILARYKYWARPSSQ
ncbi:MAG: hypothetical protein IT314_13030 [Anaerolineales bacterium]|nr:hypothetical protein [Anaerolineales bacterium]